MLLHRALATLLLPLLVALAPARAPAAERLQISPWIDGGIALGSAGLWIGVSQAAATPAPLHAPSVDPPGGIDRWASIPGDPAFLTVSDSILWGTIALGGALTLADGWRDDDLVAHTVVYAEALLINGMVTEVTKHLVQRARPYTYAAPKGTPDDLRSFFSGHTSWTATASFTAARIFDITGDLTPWERVALYGGAGALTVGVGVSRVRAGMHFPTDVLTGALVGTTIGLAVPELHRPGGWLFGGQVDPDGGVRLAVTGSF